MHGNSSANLARLRAFRGHSIRCAFLIGHATHEEDRAPCGLSHGIRFANLTKGRSVLAWELLGKFSSLASLPGAHHKVCFSYWSCYLRRGSSPVWLVARDPVRKFDERTFRARMGNKLGFSEMLAQTLFTNICNLVGTGVLDGPQRRIPKYH